MPRDVDNKQKDLKAWSNIFDMPLQELEARVIKAGGLMQQALDLFPGLIVKTEDERKHSNGRIRTGEGEKHLILVDIMEAFPSYFEGLADLDHGLDPNVLETPLMRDRIQRAEILARLGGIVGKFDAMSDTVLHLRELVRDPIKEVYGIAKAMARANQKLKSMLAPVIDFYAVAAKAAAAARKANAEAKAAAEAKG